MTDASTHAIIEAEYADYRRVKGRKVIQLVCEVPLERAADIHKRLGEPGAHDKQIWVAIALLNEKPATGQAKEPPKEKRDRTVAERCADYCRLPDFWNFLIWKYGEPVHCEDDAARAVRALCNVESRSELNTDIDAYKRWKNLLDIYETDYRHRNTPAMERGK